MADIAVIRLDATNFAAFMALVAPCQNDTGCDLFPPPAADRIDAFLAAQTRRRMAEAPASPGARRFHPDPATLSPVPSPPRGRHGEIILPAAEALRGKYLSGLAHLVAAETFPDGKAFFRLAELSDPAGEQIAIFHRADATSPWAIVHGFAKAEAEYLDELAAHPPIDGHALLRLDRWGDGTFSVTRIFVVAGQPQALTIHRRAADGTVASQHLPEDRFAHLAQPADAWQAQMAARHGAWQSAMDPAQADFAALLPGAPSRFTLIKYARDRDQVAGAHAPAAAAESLLGPDACALSPRPPSPLTLVPVQPHDVQALRAALAESDPAAALARFAAERPALLRQGARPVYAAGVLRPGMPPALLSQALGQSVEATTAADGRVALRLAYRPLPGPALVALARAADGTSSAAVLVNAPTGGPPHFQLFGTGFSAVDFQPETAFAKRLSGLLPAAPPPPKRAAGPG